MWQKTKEYFASAWQWVKEKASVSWTMRGALVLAAVDLADKVVPFIPEEVKGSPMYIAALVVLAILRARSL